MDAGPKTIYNCLYADSSNRHTRYLIGVCQPNTTDLALPQQLIGRIAADTQHGLQILDRYNVRVLRKHELVHFSDFFTIHSITILIDCFRIFAMQIRDTALLCYGVVQ